MKIRIRCKDGDLDVPEDKLGLIIGFITPAKAPASSAAAKDNLYDAAMPRAVLSFVLANAESIQNAEPALMSRRDRLPLVRPVGRPSQQLKETRAMRAILRVQRRIKDKVEARQEAALDAQHRQNEIEVWHGSGAGSLFSRERPLYERIPTSFDDEVDDILISVKFVSDRLELLAKQYGLRDIQDAGAVMEVLSHTSRPEIIHNILSSKKFLAKKLIADKQVGKGGEGDKVVKDDGRISFNPFEPTVMQAAAKIELNANQLRGNYLLKVIDWAYNFGEKEASVEFSHKGIDWQIKMQFMPQTRNPQDSQIALDVYRKGKEDSGFRIIGRKQISALLLSRMAPIETLQLLMKTEIFYLLSFIKHEEFQKALTEWIASLSPAEQQAMLVQWAKVLYSHSEVTALRQQLLLPGYIKSVTLGPGQHFELERLIAQYHADGDMRALLKATMPLLQYPCIMQAYARVAHGDRALMQIAASHEICQLHYAIHPLVDTAGKARRKEADEVKGYAAPSASGQLDFGFGAFSMGHFGIDTFGMSPAASRPAPTPASAAAKTHELRTGITTPLHALIKLYLKEAFPDDALRRQVLAKLMAVEAFIRYDGRPSICLRLLIGLLLRKLRSCMLAWGTA